jgi:MtaA/CmuA family methyltransferase
MNSKAIVRAALRGESVPRVPTGPLAVHFCAGVAGYTLREYTTHAARLAESVLRYYERFQPDAVWLSADTWVSAEAMGARVGAASDQQPFGGLDEPLIQTARDIERLPAPDVASQGRYPLMLEALARLDAALGRDVFIVACFDQYPFSLAGALMGLGNVMLKAVDDPPFITALMERCVDYAAAYAGALAAAGADMLSGGDSPAGLLGPAAYGELALPAEQKLIARIKQATDKPVSLHICGNATKLLPQMAASDANVVELDHLVSLADACRLLGPAKAIWGNLDPVGLLAQSTPDAVTSACRQAVATVQAAAHRRFVLSSGCTLAMETPHANLDALLQK